MSLPATSHLCTLGQTRRLTMRYLAGALLCLLVAFAANRAFAAAFVAPTDTVGPTITLWYGTEQNFGQNGRPQKWVNLLGNVSDPDGVNSLRYTLNGSATPIKLLIGPDNRRLEKAGDFTIDLATSDLQTGVNTVVITARDTLNNISTQTVTVNYQPTVTQPTYTIDWSTLANDGQIQNVAHVIDGKWHLENNGLRIVEPGYDRMLGFGDISWNDYEVVVPITIFDAPTTPKSSIGVVLRWNGHTNYPIYCSQPKCGTLPVGVSVRWYARTLQLYVDGNTILASTPFTLTPNQTYWLKARAETTPAGAIYRAKLWDSAQSEPADWMVTGQSTLTQPQRGAASVLIHRADVRLGNIVVTPVGLSNPPQNFPPVVNPDSAVVAPTRGLYIDVLKNDTDAGGLLDLSSVRIETPPQHGTATVNTLTGQIFYTHDGSATTQDSFTYSVRDDGTAQGNGTRSTPATVNITVSPSAPSVVLSDDFDRCLLNSAWEFVNPLSAGTYELSGVGSANAVARLTLPAGTTHNAWGTTVPNEAIRLMQSVPNSDFELEVVFDTEPTGNVNDQGLLVEQDATNFIRFDVFHSGTSLRGFVGTTINGSNLPIKNTQINAGTGFQLRLKRVGNTWTASHWTGAAWTPFATFEQALTVNKVGVYAANAGGAAYSTGIDYFFDTAAPINPEDSSQPNTLTINTVGNGSVATNPAQANYGCNTAVELNAQPANGYKFASWSGAVTGNVNPNSVLIQGPTTVTATFVTADTDITPPVITLLGANPLTLFIGDPYTDPGATATDDVDGNLTAQIVVGGDTVNTSQPGSYIVTYDVSDARGNVAVQKQRVVTVITADNTPPVITLLGDNPITLEVGTPWNDPGATAQDNVDGNLTASIVVALLGGGTIDTAVPGTYIFTYEVTDAAGNETQVRRTVNVVDSQPPVITLLGTNPIQWEAGTPWSDPGATAQDNVNGDLTASIMVTVTGGVTINTSLPGTYTLTYTVADTSGNQAQAQRVLNIVDTQRPVITLVGGTSLTLAVGEPYTEQGATATDSVDGNLTSRIVIGGDTVNTSKAGIYMVTYDVSDLSGNQATQVKRTVIVTDGESPIFKILMPLIVR